MKRLLTAILTAALLAAFCPAAAAEAPLVEAKSAVLMDIATGTVLCQQNAHDPLAPASVTKVMTLLLIMEAIDSGQLGWQDTVTASDTAAAKGGSQVFLRSGETMTVEEMVKAIAISSANDCACAMAEHLAGSEAAFVDKMNARAAQLGMVDTHFVNCTGLDDAPGAAEHLTSAWDIALMSRELLKNHPDITRYTTIWTDTLRGGSFGLSNTNKLIRFYDGATGLKTGFTSKAGYCLSASAQRDSLGLIAVVMGCESAQTRLNACRTLLDYGFAGFTLVTPQVPPAQVPVVLGDTDTVQAHCPQAAPLLLEKALAGQVRMDVRLLPQVSAPVSLGQRLGTLTVSAGDRELAQLPLVAAQAVPRLGWSELFLRFLRRVAMAA